MKRTGIRKQMVGTVISDKMSKTVIVQTKNHVVHRKYKKVLIRKAKFFVHDEKGTAKLGDVVRIRSSRPLSKNKPWRLVEIIRTAKVKPQEREGRPKRKGAGEPAEALEGTL